MVFPCFFCRICNGFARVLLRFAWFGPYFGWAGGEVQRRFGVDLGGLAMPEPRAEAPQVGQAYGARSRASEVLSSLQRLQDVSVPNGAL